MSALSLSSLLGGWCGGGASHLEEFKLLPLRKLH